MKTNTRNTLLGLLVAASFSSAAMAGNTATVAVSATVTGTCLFDTNGTLTFTLDQASTADATGTVTQPSFWCTSGTVYSITDNDGQNASGTTHRMTDGTNFIPYTFAYTASGTGAGKTSPISMDIAATVVNADYANVPAGRYTDTVTLTINP